MVAREGAWSLRWFCFLGKDFSSLFSRFLVSVAVDVFVAVVFGFWKARRGRRRGSSSVGSNWLDHLAVETASGRGTWQKIVGGFGWLQGRRRMVPRVMITLGFLDGASGDRWIKDRSNDGDQWRLGVITQTLVGFRVLLGPFLIGPSCNRARVGPWVVSMSSSHYELDLMSSSHYELDLMSSSHYELDLMSSSHYELDLMSSSHYELDLMSSSHYELDLMSSSHYELNLMSSSHYELDLMSSSHYELDLMSSSHYELDLVMLIHRMMDLNFAKIFEIPVKYSTWIK
ncbi:hypothetical protein F3Y22_tig00113726pilonHSYRG00398 [Hibiscus syriacus]|uniref:Uncharacterized protein n=1 Tax=Hibiscus syriacus TaxID=106335 RepID=A0A6A2WMI9_HIBSY|nr:hypothetical protein F3Y22_tig00113726pilonHSYRG00398 [Hibiscus syriacus]